MVFIVQAKQVAWQQMQQHMEPHHSIVAVQNAVLQQSQGRYLGPLEILDIQDSAQQAQQNLLAQQHHAVTLHHLRRPVVSSYLLVSCLDCEIVCAAAAGAGSGGRAGRRAAGSGTARPILGAAWLCAVARRWLL